MKLTIIFHRIGKDFGSRLESKNKGGYIYLLSPTPELWSKALRHRTQIVFSPDAAAILGNLNLVPGQIIVEAGTGSGSLTTSLARGIAPHGHVYTFEFNERRAELALEEFKINGLSNVVTAAHRDVCKDGFTEALLNKADALFLDVPNPWMAIAHVHATLKVGGIFASYSPCIEQVQNTCEALREHGFQSTLF